MALAPRLLDFNARTAPVTARLARGFNVTLWLLVASTLGGIALSLAMSVVVSIAVSTPLRAGAGWWHGLLVVAGFVAVRELLSIPLLRVMKSAWFQRLLGGRPRFGPLGGPGRHLFRFLLRCCACTDIRLDADVEATLAKVGAVGLVRVEQLYQHAYRRKGFDEADWPRVWEQIRTSAESGVRYGDAVRSDRWNIFWLRYYAVAKMVVPLSVIYAGGALWFVVDVARGASPLRLVQFTLVGGFVIAFVIFINYTASLRMVRILSENALGDLGITPDPDTQELIRQWQGSPERQQLRLELAPFEDKDYFPTISIRPGYVAAIRNEFVRTFLVLGGLVVTAVGALILAQWPISLAFSSWSQAHVTEWTLKVLVGTVLIPVALASSVALAFVVLSRFKRFAGVLATGVLLAVVPPLIAYALHGPAGNAVLLSSVVAAAIGVLPSAVAELIKQRPSAEGRPASAG